MKELKVRVKGDLNEWKARLIKLGSIVKDVHVEDIYFNTGSLDVLKITRKNTGDYLVRFKHKDGNFIVQPKEKIKNFNEKLKELSGIFGIKKTLVRHQIVYKLHDGTVEIDDIKEVGIFLVLVQEDPEIEWFDKNLGLINPEQIIVPFSDL